VRLPEEELTLSDLVQIVRRRIQLLLAVAAVTFLLALLAWSGATRRYQATATIRVQSHPTNNIDGMLTGDNGSSAPSDALSSDIELQTQAGLLQSNALALRTIRRLNLQSTSDFRKVADAEPDLQLGVFHKKLSVKSLGGTSLIEIGYLDPNPKVAAAVVNDLVQELIEETYESQQNSAESSTRALTGQLADLRERSEELQGQVARMQRASGIYSVGTTDAEGRPQAYSAVLAQFQQAASVLSNADENRILKEGIAEAAQSGNAELLSSLAGNGAVSNGVTNSLSALQTLRTQEATQQGQLDQLRVKFGPGYPRVAEMQANLNALETSIRDETKRVAERAASDYAVADRTYKDAKKDYDLQRVQADALNDKAIQYVITRQEADETRTLYEDLLKRLKEAGILEVLHHSTIEVTDPALVPAQPAKPQTLVYLAGGLLGGLFLGMVVALAKELLSDAVESGDDLRRLGLPFTGVLPYGHGHQLQTAEDLRLANAVRGLRGTLLRSTEVTVSTPLLLLAQVSPRQQAWFLPLALAHSFANQGKRVLLIQADGHSSTPAWENNGSGGNPTTLLVKDGKGAGCSLATLLAGECKLEAVALQSPERNLFVLPAGEGGARLSDLLDSAKLKSLVDRWRDEFDILLVHAAPVLPYCDVQALVPLADLTLLSVEIGKTSKTAVLRAYESMRSEESNEVLVVAEGGGRHAYRQYYGYPFQEGAIT
jgi:polysaccharide biosynthesis transport protein